MIDWLYNKFCDFFGLNDYDNGDLYDDGRDAFTNEDNLDNE